MWSAAGHYAEVLAITSPAKRAVSSKAKGAALKGPAARAKALQDAKESVDPWFKAPAFEWKDPEERTGGRYARFRKLGVRAPAVPKAEPKELERSESISVHKGFKVQAALCLERPPLRVVEPEFQKKWRDFKEAWGKRTGNHLTVDDAIVFMRYHFHFFQDKMATAALESGAALKVGGSGGGRGGGRKEGGLGIPAISDPKIASQAGGVVAYQKNRGDSSLDTLLNQEGLDLTFPEIGRQTVRRRAAVQKREEEVDDSNMKSLLRLGGHSLWLLVKYGSGNSWTFPKVDRLHGEAMHDTLMELCGAQLGDRLSPYLLGSCPISHWKKRGSQHPGIEGRKIFFYRGRMIPGQDLAVPSKGLITDWAWCSRKELQSHLSLGEWQAVRYGLPLDALE